MDEQNFYAKDIQIIRQSQIKLVFEYLQSKNIDFSVEQLQRATDIFTVACLKPIDDKLKNDIKNLDTWIAKEQKKKANG